MEIIDTLRIINLFLSIITIFPSVYILFYLVRESDRGELNLLRILLDLLFGSIALGSLINSFTILGSLLEVGVYLVKHPYILNARNIFMNIASAIISWGTFIIVNNLREE